MPILQDIYTPQYFRENGHALVDKLADYLEANTSRTAETMMPYQTPAESLAFWQNDFEKILTNSQPTTQNSQLNQFFDQVIARSVQVHHPHYVGHQVTPSAPLAALTGMMTELLNNGMAVYEMGMVPSPMEKLITDDLAQRFGLPKTANGLLTSGGTLANLTAMLAARAARAPTEVWTEGTTEQLAIMVSEEAHYCVDRAARIMGLGSKGIIKIPVNDQLEMKTALLETYFEKATANGLTVFAVIGSACSTSTGSFDDLLAIGDFAQKHNLWFHIDGAHGGAAVFSEKYRPLLRGSNLADSIVMDYHKLLMVPALATALVFRNGADSYRTFQQKAAYLFESVDEDWQNFGKRTFECTKYMISTKIYALMQTYGVAAFEEVVDTLFDLGKKFAQLIHQRPHFELAIEPPCNIVCFRIKHSNPLKTNELNGRIRQQIIESGKFYLVQTMIGGQLYLRTALMNPLTTEVDLTDLLDEIERLAETQM